MAKTKGRSIAGPSSLPHPLRSRPPRRRPPRIVALLATLSASHFSVHAHPLDQPQTALPFLYPSFIHQPTPSVAKRSLPSSADATTSTPPQPPPLPKCTGQAGMPDKYVLGDDGLWYKTEWSLYGSTQCPGPCPSTPAPGQDTDFPNDPTSIGNFDVSSLPTGWDIPDTYTRHGMVIVLSLSVALAVMILTMMITCVFWRRKFVPKKDPEKKRGHSSDFADDDTSRSIREAKAAQRRWSKAVSRWRGNVRFAFRRRRTERALARTTTYSTLGPEVEGLAASPSSSRSNSPTPTIRSRASTSQEVRPSSPASVRLTISRARSSRPSSPQPRVTSPYDVPPRPPSPIEPPAYHSQPAVLPPSTGDYSPPYTHSDSCPPSSSKTPVSSTSSSRPNDRDNGSLSGHVATDDKVLLSRRAALASAPLESSSDFAPSAPSIEDDDDGFEFSSGSRSSSPVCEQRPPYEPSPTSLLPPPPSKGKLKYEYSDLDLSYEIATLEPGLGPSAPPFEESAAVPSAPPLDLDIVPVPSAPVMVTEREDDMQDDVHRTGTDAMTALPGHVALTLPGDGGERTTLRR